MFLSIRSESEVPIYRQLLEQIRRMVLSGRLPQGAILPSTREIAMRFAINHMTVSKAFCLLETEGLLQRRRGKRMAVATALEVNTRLEARVDKLYPHIDALIVVSRQLDVGVEELTKVLFERWYPAT